jgi:Mg-chelatase subunit ChlD
MSSDYTSLALVVDRSGSMHNIASDVVGGVKKLIGEQKNSAGKAVLTLAQFDHTYEVIHDFKNLQEVDEDRFVKDYSPRGTTALLDAIGRMTLGLKKKIDEMPLAERPKKVVVAVITDGLENSSKEFNISQVKDLVKQQEALGWDFMFMGATLDTIDVAKNFGFSAEKTAVFNTSNVCESMAAFSKNFTQAREGKEVKFSAEDRKNLMNEKV